MRNKTRTQKPVLFAALGSGRSGDIRHQPEGTKRRKMIRRKIEVETKQARKEEDMHMNYGSQEAGEWQGAEEQRGRKSHDIKPQGGCGNKWEKTGTEAIKGTAIAYYEQERQRWGKSTQRGGDMEMQEEISRNTQRDGSEEGESKAQKAYVIEGRVTNYAPQVMKQPEEGSRWQQKEEKNQKRMGETDARSRKDQTFGRNSGKLVATTIETVGSDKCERHLGGK